MSSGTWKNSELFPSIEVLWLKKIPTFAPLNRFWDLGKLRAFPSIEAFSSFFLRLWNYNHPLPYMSSGTWKNSELSPSIEALGLRKIRTFAPLNRLWDLFLHIPPLYNKLWDLGKFRAHSSPPFWALGLGKISSSFFLHISPYSFSKEALGLRNIPSSPPLYRGFGPWKNYVLSPL